MALNFMIGARLKQAIEALIPRWTGRDQDHLVALADAAAGAAYDTAFDHIEPLENFRTDLQSSIGASLVGSAFGSNVQLDLDQLETDLITLTSDKALDAAVVHKTGDETVAGHKTLTGTLTLDYTGDTTSFLQILSPAASASGAFVYVTNSGVDAPAIIAQYGTTKRRDVVFSNTGVEIAASPTTSGPTQRVIVDDDGRFYGTALHNNAAGMTGTTNQYVGSGTYTPTATIVANVDSAGPAVFQWMRVGNVVTVSGRIDIDPTAASTLTTVRITLPIPSNLAAAAQLSGSGSRLSTSSYDPISVSGDLTNDAATIQFYASNTATSAAFITFTYIII